MDWMDEPIYQRHRLALSFLRVVALSVLWCVCSLPVVTAGPAAIAAYYAGVKVIRRGRGKLIPSFFHAFRAGFRVGAPTGLCALALAGLLVFCVRFSGLLGEPGSFWAVLRYVYLLLLALCGCLAMFLFPVHSRFQMGFGAGLRLALCLTLRHLLTAFTCLLVWYLGLRAAAVFPACLLVAPGGCFLLCSLVLEPILKALTSSGGGEDEWYLE